MKETNKATRPGSVRIDVTVDSATSGYDLIIYASVGLVTFHISMAEDMMHNATIALFCVVMSSGWQAKTACRFLSESSHAAIR